MIQGNYDAAMYNYAAREFSTFNDGNFSSNLKTSKNLFDGYLNAGPMIGQKVKTPLLSVNVNLKELSFMFRMMQMMVKMAGMQPWLMPFGFMPGMPRPVMPQNLPAAEKQEEETPKAEETKTETTKKEKYDGSTINKDVSKLYDQTNNPFKSDQDLMSKLVIKYAETDQLDALAKQYKKLHPNKKDGLCSQLCQETADPYAKKMIKTLFGERDAGKTYNVNDPSELGQAAQALHNAVHRGGTDEDTLINILGNPNYSEEDIKKIVKEYDSMFKDIDGKGLKQAIKDDTSGYFEKLLLERIK